MSPEWDTTPRAELGVCAAPDRLVPGDADAMRGFAGRLRHIADGAARVAWLIARVDAGALLGQYGTALRTRLATEPAPYAQVALALTVAADTVDQLADTVEDARRTARRAVDAYGDADQTSARWQAARTSVGAGALGGLAAADPGEDGRQAAQRLLTGAQDELAATVDRTCRVLRDVTAAAPQQDRGAAAGAVDTWRGLLGLPGRVLDDPAGAAGTVWHAARHPIDTVGGAIDDELDSMRRTPDEWAGGVLSTAGVGAAAGAVGKLARRADIHHPHAGPTANGALVSRLQPVLDRPRLWHHLFDGEFGSKGQGTGYHHRPSGNDAPGRWLDPSTRKPRGFGTYRADVVFTRPDGTTKRKKKTSFFPDNWSRRRVQEAVTQAWQSHTMVPGSEREWTGHTTQGLRIRGYLGEDALPMTAFPDPDLMTIDQRDSRPRS